MFVDEINLHLKAGNGGNGVVRWLHEKNKEFSGPAGGNGGKGGDIYAIAVRDIGRLSSYVSVSKITAESGGDGESKGKHGANGAYTEISVPVGSVITIQNGSRKGRVYELLKEGEQTLLLMGGRGGLGNKHFKSSRNIRPVEYTSGKEGEEADVSIELKLIADVGLIGKPNAGKTSLLNELTRANAKVGNYAFTTIEPNIGDFYGHIIADIPGLIEGASFGKGLGYKFLRHIARTRILLHCVSLEEGDSLSAYEAVRRELTAYDKALAEKPEYIVLTKADICSTEDIKEIKKLISKKNKDVVEVSIIDDKLLKRFKDKLLSILKSV